MLLLAVIFLHQFIRFLMLLRKSKRRSQHSPRVPSRVGDDGFAFPQVPLPVVVARDEELGMTAGELMIQRAVPSPPPYGLWRGSVVSAALESL
jgi:hypothetical protein